MREVAFIKQNKTKWLEFEQAIFGKSTKNPDEIANLYIQLVNDLSYAQTYYPKSKTVTYLNYLASQIYQKIYKTKREDKNRFLTFFSTEVPLLVYQYKRYLGYSFILFFCCVAIGVISAKYDQNFVRLILGDSYVNMTLDNIKDGNPVAVYKSGGQFGSFVGITLNNLYVGTICYLYGIFVGLGTFYSLFNNSIMFIPIFFLPTRSFVAKCSWYLDSRGNGNFWYGCRSSLWFYFRSFNFVSKNIFTIKFV